MSEVDENINELNNRSASAPAAIRSEPRVYMLHRDPPQVQLTWASKFPSKVDKLKIRKRIQVFPVAVTLKADYDTNTREFEYGCSAKDVLFGGRISLNIPDQQLEYSKRIAMPNGAQFLFAGSCSYKNRRLEPNFGVQLEFGGDTHTPGFLDGHASAVWAGNTFDVRQRFTIAKGMGVEVCGGLTIPARTARYSHNSGTLALGEGSFQLHVAEVNAILRV